MVTPCVQNLKILVQNDNSQKFPKSLFCLQKSLRTAILKTKKASSMRLFEVTAWNDPFPGITMIRNSLLLISLTSLAKASANDIFFLSTNDKTYSQSLETTVEWSTTSAIVESNSKQEIEMLMETIKYKKESPILQGMFQFYCNA